MAEWLKAHAWKVCKGVTLSWVRIPFSPPSINKKISNYLKLRHYKIITKNEPSFGINVDIKLINNIF